MKARRKRLLSLLLAASLLLQSGNLPAYAGGSVPLLEKATATESQNLTGTLLQETGALSGEAATEAVTEEEQLPQPEILSEVEENRGTHSKEYVLSDQSHAVYLYPEPVHYENEEGQLVEIDNTLVETAEGYENADNSYELLITDNEESRGQVIYKEEEYVISWQLVEQIPGTRQAAVSDNATGSISENTRGSVTESATGSISANATASAPEDATYSTLGDDAHSTSDNSTGTVPEKGTGSVSRNFTKDYGTGEDSAGENGREDSSSATDTVSGNSSPLVEETENGENILSGNPAESSLFADDLLVHETIAPSLLEAEVTEGVPEEETEVVKEEGLHLPSASVITISGYGRGISLEYSPAGDGLKENIILPTRDCPKAYTFRVVMEGLEARINEAGEVEFYDVLTDEVEYYFPAPFMVDARGELSHDAFYELREGGREAVTLSGNSLPEAASDTGERALKNSPSENTLSGNSLSAEEFMAVRKGEEAQGIFYLTIRLGEEWLAQAEYPVVVDPVLKQARGKDLEDGGSICSDGTTTETLYAGKNSKGVYRSFLRFGLPAIPSQSILSEAILYLNGTAQSENTHYLTVSMVEEPWYYRGEKKEGKALSWDSQPATGEVLDYHINGGWFNITGALRRWLSGEKGNHGLAIRALKEETVKRDTLRLQNSKTSPYLKLTYRVAVGLEDHLSTHVTGAGTAGTGYVRDATGSLTVVTGAVATYGERFPMAISHVYNSNDTGEKGGWRLNYEETLQVPVELLDITTYPYVYTDGDGTSHYFKKSDVTYLENGVAKTARGSASLPSAKDEDGLKLYVVPVTDKVLKESYPLKLIDKSSTTVRYFDRLGRLAMITDSNRKENGKDSDTREKNALTITRGAGLPEERAEVESFAAIQETVTKLKELCSLSTTTTTSEGYLTLLAKLLEEMKGLKNHPLSRADYVTAKQVHTAATKLSDLTDTTSTVSRATAKARAGEMLTALKKAEEGALALAEESGRRIEKITDGVGKEAVFSYNAQGRIESITDPTDRQGGSNRYTYDEEGSLTQITFANGKKAYYTYGRDHLLLSQQDTDGYLVTYTYGEGNQRISLVEESHGPTPEAPERPTVRGQSYGITYGREGSATFRFSGPDDLYGTEDDLENVHVFDEEGRTLCVYSRKMGKPQVIGATAATWEPATNSDGSENTAKRNKLREYAVVGGHSNNLLQNHSFEYNDDSW